MNNPKIRFAKFNAKIKIHQIKNLYETYSGLSGLDSKNFISGEDKYITYNSIFGSNIIDERMLKSVNLMGKNQNIVLKNDILITATSETPREIGVNAIYLGHKIIYLNSFSFGMRALVEIDNLYVNYLLKSNIYRKKIIGFGQGSTRYNFSKNGFKEMLIYIPEDIKEQNKIAQFFTLLDKQIQLIDRKIELYELRKKYYLNNMICSLSTPLPKITSLHHLSHYKEFSLLHNALARTEKIGYKEIQEASLGINGMYLKKQIRNVKKTHTCRVSQPLDMVIGLGSKKIDICINKFNFNVGISVAYASYELKNINPQYFNLCLEKNVINLSSLYMVISARQGKSVDKDGLFQQVFNINSNPEEQTKIVYFFNLLDKSIKSAKLHQEELIKKKTYYLNNMFV